MLLSKYFLPLQKDMPSEASIASHSLMLRSGMIKQHTAGIYSWLPIGFKVLQNVETIIRRRMDEAGFFEMQMPCIQNADLWKESGRFEGYGKEMLKFFDRHNNELLFGPTAEEVFTDLIRSTTSSHKDLPKVLYQIHTKFRDEIRPRFGVMRGREFIMKDAYSIDIDQESAIVTYNKIFKTYLNIFSDMGLRAIPMIADTGEIGGDLSHEFHIIANVGESAVYYDKKIDSFTNEDFRNEILMRSAYAATEERHDPTIINVDEISVARGIEIGHIFNFGDKYSASMKARVQDRSGKLANLQMGSYGIGVSRIPAAIIEASHDERGIIWPMAIAPFKVSVVNLNIKDARSNEVSDEIYNKLKQHNIDVLYDDTTDSVGSKLASNDLIGSPWQVLVGPKNLQNNCVELKERSSGRTEYVSPESSIENLLDTIMKSKII